MLSGPGAPPFLRACAGHATDGGVMLSKKAAQRSMSSCYAHRVRLLRANRDTLGGVGFYLAVHIGKRNEAPSALEGSIVVKITVAALRAIALQGLSGAGANGASS